MHAIWTSHLLASVYQFSSPFTNILSTNKEFGYKHTTPFYKYLKELNCLLLGTSLRTFNVKLFFIATRLCNMYTEFVVRYMANDVTYLSYERRHNLGYWQCHTFDVTTSFHNMFASQTQRVNISVTYDFHGDAVG